MKKFLWIGLVLAVLVGAAIFGGRFWSGFRSDSSEHRFIESKYELNPAQQKEVPVVPSEDLMTLYRFQDAQGGWQVSFEKPTGSAEFRILGLLSREPSLPEIDQPLYLCDFGSAEKKNIVLDTSDTCSGGKRLSSSPDGYSSRLIRTGYLMAFQCRDPKYGIYVALNSRCESANHIVVSAAGTLRAATN